MAKRKRLQPPQSDFLNPQAAPETKSAFPSYPNGVFQRAKPPIADVAGVAAAQAAADALADNLHQAQKDGRMVLELPLDAIDTDYLIRDRITVNEEDMAALVDSLRQRGQQTPIDVTELPSGQYGLISGWRRLKALRMLAAEGAGPGHVLALIRQPGEASNAYLAMIEENEIRVGLSYFERANVVARAVEQGVFDTPKAALRHLFRSASRAKRSKIGSFLNVVQALDGHIHHPEAIGERLGLALSKALEADPDLAARLRATLLARDALTAAEESALLQKVMSEQVVPASSPVIEDVAQRDAASVADDVLPGITLVDRGKGGLVLRGPGVNDTLKQALVDWLRSQG